MTNESGDKRSLGTRKKIVAAFGTSWQRRRDMLAAQLRARLREEPGQNVKQLASVSFLQQKSKD